MGSALVSDRIELDETFLCDPDEKDPRTYYLFCTRIKTYESPVRKKRRTVRKRFLQTLDGEGVADLGEQLRAFIERPDVTVVDEKKRDAGVENYTVSMAELLGATP